MDEAASSTQSLEFTGRGSEYFGIWIVNLVLTILTLGIFWFVINALMLELASALVPGFQVRSFGAAFIGAIVLSVVNLLLKAIVMPSKDKP